MEDFIRELGIENTYASIPLPSRNDYLRVQITKLQAGFNEAIPIVIKALLIWFDGKCTHTQPTYREINGREYYTGDHSFKHRYLCPLCQARVHEVFGVK
jgi:hypothetical protein